MNYDEAIEYIHSVNWVFCRPGLERITQLCHKLGDPQDRLKFVHVAGTNGKGSLCAMLDSILRKQGYNVGLYTSPYILEFNERIRVNGDNISNDELVALVEEIKPIADEMEDKPTEFELITAMAFLYFYRRRCDYVVLECGLGGRLDATNIIKTPIISVITGIALDHTSILGDTREKIAAEKAGIIKDNVPVLWCGNHAGAEQAIGVVAARKKAPLYAVDRKRIKVKKMTLEGTIFTFAERKDMELSLLGSYQVQNAANALTAVTLLQKQGVRIDSWAVKEGLSSVRWPARFEILNRIPLIIADGGHNPEGVDSTIKSIKKYFGDEKVGFICGVMADKDYDYMANKISKVAEKVFCLEPSNPRALKADKLVKIYEDLGISAEKCICAESALKKASMWSLRTGKPIICLGSLYMYGDIVRAMERI